MKKIKISLLSRVLLIVAGLALVAVLFTPIWRIELQAPQYPEGLSMQIHANKLAGNVDIINGLNHYIGMKTLHNEDFPEFKILPVVIVFFSLFFILAGIMGRRRLMNILFILFVLFGVVAMIDFWRWEYDYGHNLDPNAAIIVPGMAYQPPLIGFKQLLNFGAWSAPDTGGWIFISAGLLALFCVIWEWYRARKLKRSMVAPVLAAFLLSLTVSSCNQGPDPIRHGRDTCDFCKMPISDNRFGAEVLTKKGKAHKFDDKHCIVAFLRAGTVPPGEVRAVYFTDFCEPHALINVEKVHFLQSPNFKTPMNGNVAAFSSEDSLETMFRKFDGNKITWEQMQK